MVTINAAQFYMALSRIAHTSSRVIRVLEAGYGCPLSKPFALLHPPLRNVQFDVGNNILYYHFLQIFSFQTGRAELGRARASLTFGGFHFSYLLGPPHLKLASTLPGRM